MCSLFEIALGIIKRHAKVQFNTSNSSQNDKGLVKQMKWQGENKTFLDTEITFFSYSDELNHILEYCRFVTKHPVYILLENKVLTQNM